MHLFQRFLGITQLTEPFQVIAESNPGQLKQIVFSVLIASLIINLLSLAFPIALLQIYNRVIPNYAINTLIVLFFFVVIAMILELILRLLRSTITLWSDAKFEHHFSFKIISAILNLPIEIYHKRGIGTYIEHARQLTRIRNFYTGQALTSLLNVPFIVIFLALIAMLAGWLVLAPLLVMLIFLIITMRLASRLKKYYDKEILLDEQLNNFLIDIFANIHTLKALALETQISRKFEKVYRHQFKKQPISLYQHYLQINKLLGSQFIMIVTVIAGAPLVVTGYFTMGVLAACIILSSRCIQPLNEIFNVWIRLQITKIAHRQLDIAINFPSENKDNQQVLTNFQGNIEFKNVELHSETTKQVLFKNLNFSIKAGQFIVIPASREAGRTALLNLLTLNVKPVQGEITLDNIPITSLTQVSVRKYIRYISPQSEVFQGSIIENLSLFDKNNIARAKDIAAALGLNEYIQTFADGYDSFVDSQSAHLLPHGIKQLVKLASAFADQSCQVMLLDEASSGLDVNLHQKLIQFLKKIKGMKTIIFVTESPDVLQLADEVYTIHDQSLVKARS